MMRDNDHDAFDEEMNEGGEPFPDLDDEHVRVFSVDDEDDDLDLETAELNPEKPLLDDVLGDLEKGERYYADLYGFSDLDHAGLSALRARWVLVDAELRASVVREAFDIGQEDFSLHLTRFFLFTSQDTDPQVRQLAISALGFEADPRAAERLLHVLQHDASDDIRSEAAHSLGPYVTLAEWEELSPELADRMKSTLFELAENEGESWHVRRRAAESVAACGPNDRVNRLVQRMYDEEEIGLRASALCAAGRGNQRAWLAVAIEEFANEDAEIRFEAARSAGMFGDVDALPGLSELARDDDDTDVRHAAIAAIGEIGGAGAIRILTRLSDPARETDTDVIDDALIEAALESDPLSFDVDPDSIGNPGR